MLGCLIGFFALAYVSVYVLVARDFTHVEECSEANFLGSELDEEAVCGFMATVQPQDFL